MHNFNMITKRYTMRTITNIIVEKVNKLIMKILLTHSPEPKQEVTVFKVEMIAAKISLLQ